jgi:hypothetical protein
MQIFIREMWRAARQGPRIYFAPIRGIFSGIRKEWEFLEEGTKDDAKSES